MQVVLLDLSLGLHVPVDVHGVDGLRDDPLLIQGLLLLPHGLHPDEVTPLPLDQLLEVYRLAPPVAEQLQLVQVVLVPLGDCLGLADSLGRLVLLDHVFGPELTDEEVQLL